MVSLCIAQFRHAQNNGIVGGIVDFLNVILDNFANFTLVALAVY